MKPHARTVVELIRTAGHAPSSHNTQPWRFRVVDGDVELRLDPRSRLPVNDPYDRELVISCGAALLTLRVAAAAVRLRADVTLLPDPTAPDLLARVTWGSGPPEARLAWLRRSVAVRRTHRGPFRDVPLPAGLLDRLAAAAAEEGATLHRVEAPARRLVAGLVAEGDRQQFADPSWRRELASWLHPLSAGDGLPTSRLALPAARAVVAHVDLGGPTSHRDADLVWTAPELVVLTTPSDDRADWVRAGQALQRTLLVAAGEGVAAGFLNQPCQVGGVLRERLAASVATAAVPQVLFRVGRPRREPRPAARRPLVAVVDDPAPPAS